MKSKAQMEKTTQTAYKRKPKTRCGKKAEIYQVPAEQTLNGKNFNKFTQKH